MTEKQRSREKFLARQAEQRHRGFPLLLAVQQEERMMPVEAR